LKQMVILDERSRNPCEKLALGPKSCQVWKLRGNDVLNNIRLRIKNRKLVRYLVRDKVIVQHGEPPVRST